MILHTQLDLHTRLGACSIFFSAAADRALGMVGQQISYIVKEKDALIAKDLDTMEKQTPGWVLVVRPEQVIRPRSGLQNYKNDSPIKM